MWKICRKIKLNKLHGKAKKYSRQTVLQALGTDYSKKLCFRPLLVALRQGMAGFHWSKACLWLLAAIHNCFKILPITDARRRAHSKFLGPLVSFSNHTCNSVMNSYRKQIKAQMNILIKILSLLRVPEIFFLDKN